jgi:hypothetical protein
MPLPVDIKYVNSAERELGVKFPASFVVRMAKDNGGIVAIPPDAWHLYPFFDTSDRKRLARTCNHIVFETKKAREWPDFPADAVAIGTNGSGDQFVLMPRPDAPGVLGPVHWWDHETGDLNFVCDDFGELQEAC